MASFDFDQAEGLRRMLQGPRPRIVTFLSATPEDDKGAMLVNLGASLAQLGNEVLIVDACERDYGVARRLGLNRAANLAAVARQEFGLNQVLHAVPQGFAVASLGRPLGGNDARRLAKTFDVLVGQAGIVMVDGELGPDGEFPLPLMASSEIVVASPSHRLARPKASTSDVRAPPAMPSPSRLAMCSACCRALCQGSPANMPCICDMNADICDGSIDIPPIPESASRSASGST